MDKAPDAFRTISEAAQELDVPQHVLRFWETRFSQIRPMKRAGGRRYYRPQDIDLLRGIRRLLYDEGYTIKGVQKILREHGVAHVVAVGRGEKEHGLAAGSLPATPAPAGGGQAPAGGGRKAGESTAEAAGKAAAAAEPAARTAPHEEARQGAPSGGLPAGLRSEFEDALRELEEARSLLEKVVQGTGEMATGQ